MPDIKFRSDMDVELIDSMGNDFSLVRAARVSTGLDKIPSLKSNKEGDAGLINFLMANRHGTPFEHGSMTFRISAPIFVWREFMRHRIGFSYNEESGRYKQLDPVFYVPNADRALVQEGRPGHYVYVPGTSVQYTMVKDEIKDANRVAYQNYEYMLENGIAREVARMVLPVNIFSSAYVTCNPRSLMAFLSLRTKREDSKFPSYPQREIEMVAEQMESEFELLYPTTWLAFEKNGRVSP